MRFDLAIVTTGNKLTWWSRGSAVDLDRDGMMLRFAMGLQRGEVALQRNLHEGFRSVCVCVYFGVEG